MIEDAKIAAATLPFLSLLVSEYLLEEFYLLLGAEEHLQQV